MLGLWTGFQSRIVRDEEGAGMVEYALLVVLIAIVLILAISFLTGKVGDSFSESGTNL